jgi:hypothetical protein
MIVYRENRRRVSVADGLAKLGSPGGHEQIRDQLIEFGQLESGIADHICPDRDLLDPRLDQLRNVSLALGRTFYRSWRGLQGGEIRMERPAGVSLPGHVEVNDPEGYAYYGLFPETFAAAAEKFYRETGALHTVCIGIRSIGTSLSAVVAGTIAELGGPVESMTVRPRGHPFDRETLVSEAIRARWRSHAHSHFVIVDEGPGLSGSSFSSVAQALSDCGVPDSRIFFIPSWDPHPSSLLSEQARDRWTRHTRVVGEFESDVASSDWLHESFGPGEWRDLSAGKWREYCYAEPSEFPAVQPQHERRKFVRLENPKRMAKFVGFGSRGHAAFERARAFHEAGFAPEPIALTNGFLVSEFVPGRPATAATRSCDLIRPMAAMLAHIRREFPSNAAVPWDALIQMVHTNVEETLGPDWVDRARRLSTLQSVIEDSPTHQLDGRMLPHEWIETAEGFLKTDVADHGDDHFFPGPQDIAWDVAGVVTEFCFNPAETSAFLNEYLRASADSDIGRRISFYRVAYAAFRLAYSCMALNSVPAAERERFGRLADQYSSSLKAAILAL